MGMGHIKQPLLQQLSASVRDLISRLVSDVALPAGVPEELRQTPAHMLLR